VTEFPQYLSLTDFCKDSMPCDLSNCMLLAFIKHLVTLPYPAGMLPYLACKCVVMLPLCLSVCVTLQAFEMYKNHLIVHGGERKY
jgi:hypothetical protein